MGAGGQAALSTKRSSQEGFLRFRGLVLSLSSASSACASSGSHSDSRVDLGVSPSVGAVLDPSETSEVLGPHLRQRRAPWQHLHGLTCQGSSVSRRAEETPTLTVKPSDEKVNVQQQC